MEKVKEYTSGDVTVIWKPGLCMHSEKCWRNLPEVFKPKDRPWIQPEKATGERLTSQIDQCPSGALGYRLKGTAQGDSASTGTTIQVMASGPLIVKADTSIEMADGTTQQREKQVALCRCGASANKPYCDGSHKKIDFQG